MKLAASKSFDGEAGGVGSWAGMGLDFFRLALGISLGDAFSLEFLCDFFLTGLGSSCGLSSDELSAPVD